MNPKELADDPQSDETDQSSSGSGLLGRLFNSRGGKEVPEIQAEYDVSKPAALLVRGLQKAASKDGTPAVADLVLGAFLFIQQQSAEGKSKQQQTTEPPVEEPHKNA